MSLLAPWLAFPAIFAVLCLGAGLLIERAGDTRLPGQLLLPLGFAALVALTQLTTFDGATAELTLPLVAVMVIAGYALSIGRLRTLRPEPWLVVLAAATYVMFAAPAVLWGSRTFLGYGNLGDAAIHFEIVDLLLTSGHSTEGLPPSSFQHSAQTYFDTAYPTGGHGVLAVMRALLGVDVAWLFQPFLSVLAVLIVLGLEPVARELTSDRRLSALAAFLAGGAGLVYGYAVFQEAIKEMGGIAVLVLLVALLRPLMATPPGWRAPIPLAVATGGGLGVLSFALAPWLAPLLLAAAAALVVRHWRERRVPVFLEIGLFAVLGTLLAIPRLIHVADFVRVNKVVLQGAAEFGNLQRELDFITAFGVWPVADFRASLPPTNGIAVVLVGIAVFAALLGVVEVVRRRAWSIALFAVISLLAFAFISRTASPWAYGKSLMLLTPALVLLAAAGGIGFFAARRRAEGAILLAALAAGVLWTNALAYHSVDAAPTDRLEEMAEIGERFDGQGRAFFPEFDEYAKHFMRQTDPTGASEAFRPADPVPEAGAGIRFGFSSDIGDWSPASLAAHYNLIVVRQGPTRSRPPVGWERAFHGEYYDVWRKQEDAPEVFAQMLLGHRLDAAAEPRCREVRRLADVAEEGGGRLAYAPREPVIPFVPGQLPPPANWGVDSGDTAVMRPVGPGRIFGTTRTPAGTYSVWFEASAQRAAVVRVDGKVVGAVEDHLNPRLSATRLGTVTLDEGRHEIRIDVGGGDLEPGNGGFNRIIGPVYLVPDDDPGDVPVETIPTERWRSLCGRHLDWIQAIR